MTYTHFTLTKLSYGPLISAHAFIAGIFFGYFMSVAIFPHDETVPKIFQEITSHLEEIIPYKVTIEHIGSTSIVRLGGKGVIDVLIIADQKKILYEIGKLLKSTGFDHNAELKHAEDRYFASGDFQYNNSNLHIHIHLTYRLSQAHKEIIVFRNYLRTHPNDAIKYYELKKN